MTIVIPEELVPLLRDGLYFDLHGQLEEAGALVEPRGRADISDGVAGCLARAERARALLDVVGWIHRSRRPRRSRLTCESTTTRCCAGYWNAHLLRAQRRGRPGSRRRGARDRESARQPARDLIAQAEGAPYEHFEDPDNPG